MTHGTILSQCVGWIYVLPTINPQLCFLSPLFTLAPPHHAALSDRRYNLPPETVRGCEINKADGISFEFLDDVRTFSLFIIRQGN